MKFWKSLSGLIEETLPDWRDKFLSYKDLKKQLKQVDSNKDKEKEDHPPAVTKRRRLDGSNGGGGEVAKEVGDFVRVLEDEMEKFNSFIVEKEEDFVIKWKELQDRVGKAKDSKEELMRVGREIVDFHGEMILLENYSALNYTGLVKILKKYDKQSGELVRLPFIQKIMQQPFFTTQVLNQLVKECETMIDCLFSKNELSVSQETTAEVEYCDSKISTGSSDQQQLSVPEDLSEIKNMESMYMKLTLSALRVLKEIRSGSSTVNMFSLPPLQINTLEDWKKVPVVEQVAK